MEEEKEKKIELPEEIKKDPYSYICNYVESLYPHTGKRVFEVLSLIPPSLILPDFNYGGKKIRSNMNAMFLAPSGAGKTSLAKLFAKLSYNSIELESITSASLESVIAQNSDLFSLVVGDFARMSRDQTLMKVLEGILGEEKQVKRKTMRKDLDIDTEGVALLCGVSTDLHSYMLTGMIFRVVPLLVSHNAEEHSNIGKIIASRIGVSAEDKTEEIIKEYYRELLLIQSDGHKKIKRIDGYFFPKEFSEGIYDEWNFLTNKHADSTGIQWYRELQEGFRFLISHAFLNIFNRRVENGILYPNEDDFNIAIKLMKQTIIFKMRLLTSESWLKQLKSAKDFKRLMESDKVDSEVKSIMKNLVSARKNKK